MFSSIDLLAAIGFEGEQNEETGKIISLKKCSSKSILNQLSRNNGLTSSSSPSENSSPSKEDEDEEGTDSFASLMDKSIQSNPARFEKLLLRKMSKHKLRKKAQKRINKPDWLDLDSEIMDFPLSK